MKYFIYQFKLGAVFLKPTTNYMKQYEREYTSFLFVRKLLRRVSF